MNSLPPIPPTRTRRALPLFRVVTGERVDRRWYYLSLALIIIGIPVHQPLIEVSGFLLLLLLCLIDIWASYCLRDLHYQRQFSQRQALFGEEITLSVSIENAKLLPLPWLEMEDNVPRLLPIRGQRLSSSRRSDRVALEGLFSPRGYERITRRYIVQCNQRGVHSFGPTILRSSDLFGFIKREIRLANEQFVLVYPLVAPLTSFNLPSRHPFGERRAPRRLLEDPSRVIGVRDYQYGDSLKRVNWKATARTLQLQSKVYEPTTTHTLVIFLNTSAQLDVYFGIHPELQELSICAAASIGDWALNEGYAVGLYANTIMFMPDDVSWRGSTGEQGEQQEATVDAQLRRRRIRLPASSSEEQRKRFMEVLARIQPYFGTTIEEVMLAERSQLPAGATIVVITSSLSEMLIDTLARLRQGGHAVSLLFVGDTPPPTKLAGVSIYHVGGEETWEQLSIACTRAPDGSERVGIEPVGLAL